MTAATTTTIGPAEGLAAAIARAPAGAVLVLRPGRYFANLLIRKSLTLRGGGDGVILDGTHRGSVLRVAGEDTKCSLEKLTIRGGAGSALLVDGAEVFANEVTFEKNHAQDGQPGSAAAIVEGRLVLDRCRVTGNAGHAAVFIGGGATAAITDTTISDNAGGGAALWVDEAARLTLLRTTVSDNRARIALHVTGTPFAAPTVTATDCHLAATVAVENGPRDPGSVTLAGCQIQGEVIGA